MNNNQTQTSLRKPLNKLSTIVVLDQGIGPFENYALKLEVKTWHLLNAQLLICNCKTFELQFQSIFSRTATERNSNHAASFFF